MEHNLTCNNLQCRSELSDRALVTTCRSVAVPILLSMDDPPVVLTAVVTSSASNVPIILVSPASTRASVPTALPANPSSPTPTMPSLPTSTLVRTTRQVYSVALALISSWNVLAEHSASGLTKQPRTSAISNISIRPYPKSTRISMSISKRLSTMPTLGWKICRTSSIVGQCSSWQFFPTTNSRPK